MDPCASSPPKDFEDREDREGCRPPTRLAGQKRSREEEAGAKRARSPLSQRCQRCDDVIVAPLRPDGLDGTWLDLSIALFKHGVRAHKDRLEMGGDGNRLDNRVCFHPDCNLMEFSSPRILRDHCRAVHEKRRDLCCCEDCGKVFSYYSSLSAHRRWCGSGKRVLRVKRFPCPRCAHSSDKLFNLQQHIISTHDKKDYVCSQCGAACSTPSNRTRHVKRKHPKLQ